MMWSPPGSGRAVGCRRPGECPTERSMVLPPCRVPRRVGGYWFRYLLKDYITPSTTQGHLRAFLAFIRSIRIVPVLRRLLDVELTQWCNLYFSHVRWSYRRRRLRSLTQFCACCMCDVNLFEPWGNLIFFGSVFQSVGAKKDILKERSPCDFVLTDGMHNIRLSQWGGSKLRKRGRVDLEQVTEKGSQD